MSASKLVIRNYSNNTHKDGSCLIFLRYTFRCGVAYFSTQESVLPIHWNKKEGAVKKTYKGYLHLNEYLQSFKVKIDSIVRKAKLSDDPNDIPTVDYVKNKYAELQNKKKVVEANKITFYEFVDKFIKESENLKRPSTIKTYKSARTYLQGYEKNRGVKLDWASFDVAFYNDFQKYFNEDMGCANATFGGAIKNVKVFLNEARERKINPFDHFKSKKFAVVNTPSDNIYLNETEIASLAALDLSTDKKLDRVRDLFVLACYCGLRFSDFSILRAEHFVGNRLRIKTIKTNTNVEIPLHPLVKEIREKYKEHENGLPKPVSNQKMNNFLKIIGKMAGIDRNVEISTYKGSAVLKETKKAWELISTHTARRSFATNLYKQGFQSISIMKVTGHTTERAFMKYIKVGLEENANMLETHWEKFYEEQRKVAENSLVLQS